MSKHLYVDEDTLKLLQSIKIERKKRGLTIFTLAEAIGVNFRRISDYEREKCVPNLNIFLKLAEFFDWDISSNINFIFSQNNDNFKALKKILKLHNISFCEFQRLTFWDDKNLFKLFNGEGSVAVFAELVRFLNEEARLAEFRHYPHYLRKKVLS